MSERIRHRPEISLGCGGGLKAGTLVEILREFSAGSTGLQIVYPATQDQPKRVRLLIERIAAAFSLPGA